MAPEGFEPPTPGYLLSQETIVVSFEPADFSFLKKRLA